mgnify:CR=1 FL=1
MSGILFIRYPAGYSYPVYAEYPVADLLLPDFRRNIRYATGQSLVETRVLDPGVSVGSGSGFPNEVGSG